MKFKLKVNVESGCYSDFIRDVKAKIVESVDVEKIVNDLKLLEKADIKVFKKRLEKIQKALCKIEDVMGNCIFAEKDICVSPYHCKECKLEGCLSWAILRAMIAAATYVTWKILFRVEEMLNER